MPLPHHEATLTIAAQHGIAALHFLSSHRHTIVKCFLRNFARFSVLRCNAATSFSQLREKDSPLF